MATHDDDDWGPGSPLGPKPTQPPSGSTEDGEWVIDNGPADACQEPRWVWSNKTPTQGGGGCAIILAFTLLSAGGGVLAVILA